MKNIEFPFFTIFFIFVALWNLTGAVFGYFNTALTFQYFFSRELTDPLIYTIYKGAWGTTLVYFIGYLIVAFNPARHTGIVIVGGIGKVGFAITLLQLYLSEIANPIVFVVIIGDFICSLLFLYYLVQMHRLEKGII
jgi:hypothetical protein